MVLVSRLEAFDRVLDRQAPGNHVHDMEILASDYVDLLLRHALDIPQAEETGGVKKIDWEVHAIGSTRRTPQTWNTRNMRATRTVWTSQRSLKKSEGIPYCYERTLHL